MKLLAFACVMFAPWPKRLQCHVFDHQWSWVRAAELGLPGPICKRCDRPTP